MNTDPTSPTGSDLRKLAFDLSTHYAQEKGLVPRPTPMKALIDGNITVADLERRLKLAGLEMYPDASGANFIRTIEAGNLHRELVKAERAVARMESEQYVYDAVSGSREEPTISLRRPSRDVDGELDDLLDREAFGE